MNTPKHISNEASRSLPETKPEKNSALERLIFFSDAIFAIAITLLALDIRLPSLPLNVTDTDLFNALLAIGPKYYSFSMSFLAIGLYWLGHHRLFQYIARYDTILLLLNLLLLMCIAFIPFPSAVIGDYDNLTASIFYALTLAITGSLSAGMWLYASAGGRLLSDELDRRSFRFSLFRVSLAPTLFLLSVGVAALNPFLARILWYLIALVSLIIALLDRKGWRKEALEREH
ncbi:hypothetical protein KSF_089110 [Reticulibacter mediterranei]|uniref:DUF1211 domain-containing protein n=1 Tax=Reticulibacter mediterranei TaxID=2778369 RepID=A0A8J3IUN7_9CHLR|nr:TMEM175 family protein [Reticulibacter mediterranei]GHO98863.1 hypothetical protein KSF_089110 [Reticulibacter mediterranei]